MKTGSFLLSMGIISLLTASGCSRVSDVPTIQHASSLEAAPVGSEAKSYLTDDAYDELVVEIVAVEGFEPSDEALVHLRSFLEARLNKPAGIQIVVAPPIPPTGLSSISVEQVYGLEQRHRTQYHSGTTASAFFLFLDAPYSADGADSQTLGIAYTPTSMAIFEKTILDHTNMGAARMRRRVVEGTILTHEFGHILGLVNIGTPMVNDHADHSHSDGHCNNPDCIMYYAINTTRGWPDFVFSGFVVPPLDQECIHDLKAAGGK
ncbi:MAG: peptidase [Bdellovibrionota bacterium]